ncbi:MAG: beta-ketoacyl-ACP synthase II [Gemmatimonadaceae bacterium]
MSKRRVVVTGMGLITPCGTGVERSWQALINGESGVKPITLIDASMLQTRFAGEVRDFVAEDFMDRKQARRLDRYQQFAMAAAQMAMDDCGFVATEHNAERAAVIVGSCVGGLAHAEDATIAARPSSPGKVSPFFILNVLINMAASHISIRYGFKGPNWSTNSACATSAHAIGEAYRLIQRGEVDVALAGGAEAPIGFMCIAGFNAIRALSTRNDDPTRASRPFDAARDGFVLGEGAAILVLEERAHAQKRGAKIYAELSGYGASSDAHHVTAPSPEHEGAQRCLRSALADAALDVSQIDYINAHGTSTPLGDIAEIIAIKRVFGAQAYRVPVSSTKSMTGHLTGAAGSAEAIVSILALQHGLIPPTINLDNVDPAIDLDCVPNVARVATCNTVMTNSFGFGGTNASLIFSRAD